MQHIHTLRYDEGWKSSDTTQPNEKQQITDMLTVLLFLIYHVKKCTTQTRESNSRKIVSVILLPIIIRSAETAANIKLSIA